MQIAIVSQDKKCWVVEADDGRRFVISGKRDVKVCPEGSAEAIVTSRGIPYKTALRLLERELEK